MPTYLLPNTEEKVTYDFVGGFAGRAGSTTIINPQPGENIVVGGSVGTDLRTAPLPAGASEHSYVSLVCVSAGEWVVRSMVGVWILT